jgi:transcriptional regulator with XRE-family HTH domain
MADKRERGLEVNGPHLKAMRICQNLSIEQVAGAEMSVSALKNMEKGGTFDESKCLYVARQLGIDVAVFLDEFYSELEIADEAIIEIVIKANAKAEKYYKRLIRLAEWLRVMCFLKKLPVVVRFQEGSLVVTLACGDVEDVSQIARAFCAGVLPIDLCKIVLPSHESINAAILEGFEEIGIANIKFERFFHSYRIVAEGAGVEGQVVGRKEDQVLKFSVGTDRSGSVRRHVISLMAMRVSEKRRTQQPAQSSAP